MPAKIIELGRQVPEILLPSFAHSDGFDTRMRVSLAISGPVVALAMRDRAQGQLWERLAEWGERQ